MAPLNGIEHGDAHSAIGDVIATVGIAKLIANKAPNVWKASMLTMDKNQTLNLIKMNYYFVQMNIFMEEADLMFKHFICQHPQYQWPLCFDLKHDPIFYLKMPIQELDSSNEKTTKIY